MQKIWLVFTSLFPEQMQYINTCGWKEEDRLPSKVPLPATMIIFYSVMKETPKKHYWQGQRKGNGHNVVGCLFLNWN